ncbi:MAG: NAD(P)H-dependent oxidoreductase [Pirellulaceae bacterium]|nr:NAD(P)H-dependent oxidoreductase [Pirellulaceae bacterium]
MFVVFSTSLNPGSRSRILANFAHERLQKASNSKSRLIDLAITTIPPCDASGCYTDPNVVKISKTIQAAQGILIATPIYNYNVSSSAKNLVELTGKAWTDKVVGFLCAAGGEGSYMGCMGLANSLMLDFRTLVLPRFVYATGDAFAGDQIGDTEIENRIMGLVEQLMAVSQATMPPDA